MVREKVCEKVAAHGHVKWPGAPRRETESERGHRFEYYPARISIMTFVASPRIRSVGCIYADRCVYADGCVYASGGCVYAAGAYMHPGVYTRVGAYTRTVGAYTQGVCIRTPSRIHRFLCIRTPDCVYAGIDEP